MSHFLSLSRQLKPPWFPLVAGDNPVHQLLYRWNAAVGIERIRRKIKGIVSAEGQIIFQRLTMGSTLQLFLDTEAAWVRLATGGIAFVLGPVGKSTLAETTHAINLVFVDFL